MGCSIASSWLSNSDGTRDYCMVVNGRYVGEASALDNKTDVGQQISAQYRAHLALRRDCVTSPVRKM